MQYWWMSVSVWVKIDIHPNMHMVQKTNSAGFPQKLSPPPFSFKTRSLICLEITWKSRLAVQLVPVIYLSAGNVSVIHHVWHFQNLSLGNQTLNFM